MRRDPDSLRSRVVSDTENLLREQSCRRAAPRVTQAPLSRIALPERGRAFVDHVPPFIADRLQREVVTVELAKRTQHESLEVGRFRLEKVRIAEMLDDSPRPRG